MSISNQTKLSTADWIETELEIALGHVLQLQSSGPKASTADLMNWTGGKLFEFYAFVEILKDIKAAGGYSLKVKNLAADNTYTFNGGPGRLDPNKSHVAVLRNRKEIATIWQNVEFTGIGFQPGAQGTTGDYHEADVLILEGESPKGGKLRPNAAQLFLVMECKFTAEMPKAYLRNMLGLRRVMSFLSRTPIASPFLQPLPSLLNAIPAIKAGREEHSSHLVLAYSFGLSGKNLKTDWAQPAQTFGIEYWQC